MRKVNYSSAFSKNPEYKPICSIELRTLTENRIGFMADKLNLTTFEGMEIEGLKEGIKAALTQKKEG